MHQPLELRSNELHHFNRVLQPYRGHMHVQARAPLQFNLLNPLNGPFAFSRQRNQWGLPVRRVRHCLQEAVRDQRVDQWLKALT